MWNKFEKQELKYSLDNGKTWLSYNPRKYRLGNVIEINSEDCKK